MLGIIRGEKKLDSSILEVGIMDYLEAFGIVFGISIFYFARIVRSASFLFLQSILNKVSRYGCEKECGYMNFFFNVRKKRGEKKTWSLNERHIFNLIHDCLTRN